MNETDLAVSGADGDADFGRCQNGEGGADFNSEAAGRRQLGEVLTHRFDDPTAPHPKPDGDANATVEEDVGRRRWVLQHRVFGEDEPNGHQGADGVADVVAAVREGTERGRQDLQEGEELHHFRRVADIIQRRFFRPGHGRLVTGAGRDHLDVFVLDQRLCGPLLEQRVLDDGQLETLHLFGLLWWAGGSSKPRYHDALDDQPSDETHSKGQDHRTPPRNQVQVQQTGSVQHDGEHIQGQRSYVE